MSCGLIVDLDGVVYRGDQPCPGAVAGLADAREHGARVVFLTNNASRPPSEVAAHLSELGVPAAAEDVVTSSDVAAAWVSRQGWGDGLVLCVGGPGVAIACEREGLRVITAAQRRSEAKHGHALAPILAVVQGYGPDLGAADLSEVAYALADGAHWVATNADASIPTPRGIGVGNGSLLAAVATATGKRPDVIVGKPNPEAYRVAVERLGMALPDVLAIGDRIDTDIVGGNRCGVRTALVLTGVATRADADAAANDPDSRPDVVAEQIGDLAAWWRPSAEVSAGPSAPGVAGLG